MNKSGFTLVEILSVIVLISLLLGLGIPGIIKLKVNMNKRSYATKKSEIEQAAVIWGNDNVYRLRTADCEVDSIKYNCYKMKVKELINEDYLPSEKQNDISYTNPVNGEEIINKCVYVYRKNNRVYARYTDSEC